MEPEDRVSQLHSKSKPFDSSMTQALKACICCSNFRTHACMVHAGPPAPPRGARTHLPLKLLVLSASMSTCDRPLISSDLQCDLIALGRSSSTSKAVNSTRRRYRRRSAPTWKEARISKQKNFFLIKPFRGSGALRLHLRIIIIIIIIRPASSGSEV